jgi:hypothetical protein
VSSTAVRGGVPIAVLPACDLKLFRHACNVESQSSCRRIELLINDGPGSDLRSGSQQLSEMSAKSWIQDRAGLESSEALERVAHVCVVRVPHHLPFSKMESTQSDHRYHQLPGH